MKQLAPTPPRAEARPHNTQLHGETRVDDYFWLRERDDPAVLAYLTAENDYAAQIMAPTAALQAQLVAEMRGRIKESDSSLPVMIDGFWHYTRTLEGQQYPLFCRKPGSLEAAEEVLLDQNQLAAGQPFCALGGFALSPDQRYLAYSLDVAGDEVFTLYLKDLASGTLLTEQIPNVYYGLEWAESAQPTLFYTTLDAAKRPYRLWRHILGDDPAQDALVYEEADEAFFLSLRKTRSRSFLIVQLHSTNAREMLLVAANAPDTPPLLVEPRRPGHEYEVEHQGDRLLIVSNDAARNFRLFTAPLTSPGRAGWRELLPERAGVLLDGVSAFRDYLVLSERQGGLPQLRLLRSDGHDLGAVQFPEAAYTVELGDNPSFESTTLRFVYSSLLTPRTVVDYEIGSQTWHARKQQEIPSGYDPTQYRVERLLAPSRDGTLVPISLVYRSGEHGPRRLLLTGYGAYGVCYDPAFSAQRLSLLERGFAFAIAHVRGGSELGRDWYDDGRLLAKQHSFDDLIAAAELLIAQGYTSSDKLAIQGVSAGGLLVGAAMTQRPELFKAVVAKVPFVDVINTMLDPTLPLVVNEWEQWGNPAEATFYKYMRAYSPYDNVAARAYPHLLITAGLNDPRVCYWEPAKWAAKLRASSSGDQLLVLKTNLDAGHGGASGRYDYLHELAFEYAFLLTVV